MDKKYTTIEIYTESTPKQLIPFNRKGKPNRNHTFAGTQPKLKLKTYFNEMNNLQDPLDNIPLSVPHFNASYDYTILYEHWIAKIIYLESFSQTMEQNSLITKSLHYVTSIKSNKNLEHLMTHGQTD